MIAPRSSNRCPPARASSPMARHISPMANPCASSSRAPSMRISEFAVRNVPLMLVASLLLAALGFSAWSKISRTEDPHFPISAFSIVLVYPGADPQEIERQIVQPIEDAIHTLDDVKELNSTAADSPGIVQTEESSVGNRGVSKFQHRGSEHQ